MRIDYHPALEAELTDARNYDDEQSTGIGSGIRGRICLEIKELIPYFPYQ